MTRRSMWLTVVMIVLGCRAPTTHPRVVPASDEATVRADVTDIASATERNDADALAPRLAPDFTFVNPAGLLVTKEQFLNNMRTGRLHNTSYKVDELQVRLYGTTAVVTYRSTVAGTAGMQSMAPVRRRTMVLVERGGRWIVVAQQTTPVLTR